MKFNKPELLLLALISYVYLFFIDVHYSSSYSVQYFLYDYNFGFLKRGFLGTIINFLPIKTINEPFVLAINKILFAILLFIICKIIDKINFKDHITSYILLICFITCPALLKNLWYDLKLDVIWVIYCGLFLLIPKKLGKVALLISPILLLVHEGFFFLCIPTLISITFIRKIVTLRKDLSFVLFLVLIYFICLLVIKFYGAIDVDYDQYINYLKNKSNDNLINKNLQIEKNLMNGNEIEDIKNSIKINFSSRSKIAWLLGITIITSLFIFLKNIFDIYKMNISKYYIYIFLPILFTFVMCFLGYDLLRWISNMGLSMFMISLCILLESKEKTSEKIEILQHKFYFLFFIILLYLPFKYLGVGAFFS